MADYVRETILSQGYARIEKISLSASEKAAYEVEVKHYQEARGKLLLCSDIRPEVKTKDGSLIVYATVYGSLADVIGEYQDFEESLSAVFASSKMLADACVLESLFLSKATRKQLVRSEARTGVVGTTKDLFDRVKLFINSSEEYSYKKINNFLDYLDARVLFLNDQLNHAKDRVLVWKNFGPLLSGLPSRPSMLSLNQNRMEAYQKRVSDIKKLVAVQLKAALSEVNAHPD